MPEIKHDFTAGKMNKDLDERLVRNGEYRDALNIQVRTTSGDDDGLGDSGTVQNIQGNDQIGTATGNALVTGFSDTNFTCVGAIGHEKTDKAYFLFTSGGLDETDIGEVLEEKYRFDTIIEQDLNSGQSTPVVIDKWAYQTPVSISGVQKVWNSTPTGTFTQFTAPITLKENIRENMIISFYVGTDVLAKAKVKEIVELDNVIVLYDQFDGTTYDLSTVTTVVFKHERMLNFNSSMNITGLNIIDDLLFFTDNENEPKKINITRCKAGTDLLGDKHTQLKVTDENGVLQDGGSLEFGGLNSDLLKEHITVIRPAPKTPPTLDFTVRNVNEMEFTIEDYWLDGTDFATLFADAFSNFDSGLGFFQVGSFTSNVGSDQEGTVNYGIPSPSLDQTSFQPGDIISIKSQDSPEGYDQLSFKVEFISYLNPSSPSTTPITTPSAMSTIPTTLANFKLLTLPDGELNDEYQDWELKVVNTEKPKFELKFARFGYRYKYEDGEYSAFSPWSEIAFDPGVFDYDPKKGFNLGMVNTIQELTIKDFIQYYTDRALDIKEVDILYKSTDSPNVYTVKTIKKEIDPEWEYFSPGNLSGVDSIETGSLKIKTENIHRAIPSNQTLRTFDNVPRYALAQEITGSRILYGNFVQGFDITFPVSLTQNIQSTVVDTQPKKSVKTIREYTLGMVLGDKYGRETPVISSNKLIDVTGDGIPDGVTTNDIEVLKDHCAMSNKFVVQQSWTNPIESSTPESMDWLDYVKYYVKETSNEYYNLVLDRWYYAREKENIWLSFTSADRNKVDIETYLILKKAHGTNDAVLDKARYKVIAIENEAPDFIKTDHRHMGHVPITGTNVTLDGDDLNTAEPIKLTNPDVTHIEIEPGEFETFLNSYGSNLRGDLYARVVGRTINEATDAIVNEIVSGDFKKVTHHYTYSSTDTENPLKIVFDKSFGQSANMVDRFNAAGFDLNTTEADNSGNDLQYFLEFKEQVIENKPEFDGRFFVLIEKDFSIEEHVEKLTTSMAGFLETDQIIISYIDTQQINPALNGPFSTSGLGAGTTWGGSNGLYNATVFGSQTLTDSGGVDEWWGFGNFYQEDATTNINAGNDTINFFALGCDHLGFYQNQVIDVTGTIAEVTIEPVNVFSTNYTNKTLNFTRVTRNFWGDFKDFHASINEFANPDGSSGLSPRDKGASRSHLIFLDGARANAMVIDEPSEDVTSTDFQGYTLDYSGNVTGIVTNDTNLYANPPSKYNYKPTALDEGRAGLNSSGNQTYGRIHISQLSKDDGPGFQPREGHNDVGDATDIYNYFTTVGTYFEFLDDDSNNGEPYVYKIIDRDILDESIYIGPQKTSQVKNYGELYTLNAYAATGSDWDSVQLAWTKNIIPDGQLENITSSGPTDSIINFGGENIDLWTNANISSDYLNDNTIGFDDDAGTDDAILQVGAKPNSDNNDYDQKWKWQRRCGQCGSDDDGQREGELCNRSSVRFEFRKVDMSTGQVTNEGLDINEFDPRGYAKHDGTAGGIRIAILQNTNLIGGDVIEIESDKSVWETEPKEGTELDIYYEASHAIPVKLQQGNTHSFAPMKSKVYTKSGNSINYLGSDIDGNKYENVMVGGAGYTEKDVLIKVISDKTATDGTETEGLVHTTGIGVGQNILFEHSSGLITRSVVDSYYKLDANNKTYIPQTEYLVDVLVTQAGVDAMNDDNPYGYVTIYDTGTTNISTNITHGMSITGGSVSSGLAEVIQAGTFIKYFPEASIEDGQIQITNMQFAIDIFGDFDVDSVTVVGAVMTMPTGFYKIDEDVYQYEVELGWHNCYSFGNGVESDRIRDDFNAPQLDNGIKVSTTVVDYGQEDRSNSIIFSGLYNTTSGVNDLNEFNMGEGIIKDTNPIYGSIQRLKTRDTDVVTFCEDRILKIQANKEAVFMADNDPNIVATDRVLGQVSTFKGDYGISKNPESLASDQYRIYFTDSQRGAVLRLSMDGLTPISNIGMKSWFRTNFKNSTELLGTFDTVNGEYNLTLNKTQTVSFNEAAKGWVSFKSFIPDEGVSVTGSYLTVKNSGIFKHYVDKTITNSEGNSIGNRNVFYNANEPSLSTVTVIFNDMSGTVKSFKYMNYEGSQARIDTKTALDGEYYNIYPNKKGWWVSNFYTDLQEGQVKQFKNKEGKWFNRVMGVATTLSSLDTREFSVQGIGLLGGHSTFDDSVLPEYAFTIKNDPDQ